VPLVRLGVQLSLAPQECRAAQSASWLASHAAHRAAAAARAVREAEEAAARAEAARVAREAAEEAHAQERMRIQGLLTRWGVNPALQQA